MRGSLAQRLFGADAQPVQIGRYDVEGRLGEGAMGTVYRAHDPVLDRMVAVKVVVPHVGGSDEAAARSGELFRKEARTLARLQHPNVLAVLDVGECEGRPFIAMALAEGGSLLEWAYDNRMGAPGRLRAVLDFFQAAARGLHAAHAAGVIHRDIKPSNLLLDGRGVLQLADFGLAQSNEVESVVPGMNGDAPDSIASSAAGAGTPAYMAPEQQRGEANTKSDQFSLCATFWEIAGGARAFEADSAAGLRAAIADAEPSPPVSNSNLPPWFEALLRRGMSKNPDDRFESIETLLLAFERGRRRKGRVAALGLTALAAVGAALLLSTPPPPDNPCKRVPGEVRSAWTPEHQQAVADALAKAGAHAGALDATSETLNAYVVQWSAAWTDACHATWVAPAHSEPLELRMRCLGRAKAAFIAVASDITPETVSPMRLLLLGPALAALADPAQCDAPNQDGTASPALPSDATLRAEVAGLDDQVAALRARTQSMSLKEMASILVLEDAVQATEYAPLQVSWAIVAGEYYATVRDDQAIETLERGLAIAEGAGLFSEAVTTAARLAQVSVELARDLPAAKQYNRKASSLLSRISDTRVRSIREAEVITGVANLLAREGQSEAALLKYGEAIAITERVFGPNSGQVAHVLALQASCLRRLSRYDESRAALERALEIRQGESNARLEVITMQSQMFLLALDLGDGPTAVRYAKLGVADSLEFGGPYHPNTVGARANVGAALVLIGDKAGARAAYREGVDALEKIPRGDTLQVLMRTNLAELTEDLDEAAQIAGAARDIAVEEFGVDSFSYALALSAVALVAQRSGDLEVSMPAQRQALAAFERLGRTRHTIGMRTSLATLLIARGELPEASTLITRALDDANEAYGASSSRTVTVHLAHARLLHAQGDTAGALRALETGHRLGAEAKDRAEALSAIAALRAEIEALPQEASGPAR